MIDIKLLLLHSNTRKHLTVCKWMYKSKYSDFYLIEIFEIICKEKWAQTCLKMFLAKCLQIICIFNIYV